MSLPIDTGDVLGLAGLTPMLLTVEVAAALLGLGRTTTYELVMRGQLQSVKIGRRRLVVRNGLHAYISDLLTSQSGDEASLDLQSSDPIASAASLRSGSRMWP